MLLVYFFFLDKATTICAIGAGTNCADTDWVQRTLMADENGNPILDDEGNQQVYEVPYVDCRKDTSTCTVTTYDERGPHNWETVNPRAPCDILSGKYYITQRLDQTAPRIDSEGNIISTPFIIFYCVPSPIIPDSDSSSFTP